jgi:hypothetical protein
MQKAEFARVNALLAKPMPALRTVRRPSYLGLNVLMRPQTPLKVLLARILSGSSAPKPKRRRVLIMTVVDDGEAAALAPALAPPSIGAALLRPVSSGPLGSAGQSTKPAPSAKPVQSCPAGAYSCARTSVPPTSKFPLTPAVASPSTTAITTTPTLALKPATFTALKPVRDARPSRGSRSLARTGELGAEARAVRGCAPAADERDHVHTRADVAVRT